MKHKRILNSVVITVFAYGVYSTVSLESLFALLVAVAVHEAGHIAAIYFCGLKPTKIKLEFSGLCIGYNGLGSAYSDVCVALSGPFLGMLFAWGSCRCSVEMVLLSSKLSCLYSLVNMLPVKPLDGWRIFTGLSDIWLGVGKENALPGKISKLLCFLSFILGLCLMIEGEGGGVLAFSLWLMLLQT